MKQTLIFVLLIFISCNNKLEESCECFKSQFFIANYYASEIEDKYPAYKVSKNDFLVKQIKPVKIWVEWSNDWKIQDDGGDGNIYWCNEKTDEEIYAQNGIINIYIAHDGDEWVKYWD